MQGVLRRGGALHGDGGGLELQGLLGLGGEDDCTGDPERGPHVLSGDFLIIFQGVRRQDDLKVFEAGAVVELHKAEAFQVPDGPGPAADGDGLAPQGLSVGENARDFDGIHSVSPFPVWKFSGAYHYKRFVLILQP